MSIAPSQLRAVDIRTQSVLKREEHLKNVIAMLCDAIESRKDLKLTHAEKEAGYDYVLTRARAVLR